MKPFNIEFRTIGGWHDGVRTRVEDTAVGNALVTAHEKMHERIFRETSDGQLHAACCRALERKLVGGSHAEVLEDTVTGFLNASLVPHEVFATYLSVKGMPVEVEQELLDQMTDEYVGYYRQFADVVDKEFASSYLQFLMGWNAAVAVFTSSFRERFRTLDTRVPICLTHDEHPELRFRQLLSHLQTTNFDGLRAQMEVVARTACEHAGIAYWDIFSETAWSERNFHDGEPSFDAVAVEEELSKLIRKWIRHGVSFTFLDDSRLAIAFAGNADVMLAQLNLQPERYAVETIKWEELDRQTHSEAIHESGARISNTNSRRLRHLNGEILNSHNLFEAMTYFAVYSACPPNRNLTTWSLFFWKEHPDSQGSVPAFFAEFDVSDVIGFLKMWLERISAGHKAPSLRAVVVAIQNIEEWVQIMVETEFFLFKHEQIFARLCWYWWGRYYDIYQIFCDGKRPIYVSQILTDGAQEYLKTSPSNWRYNGLVLKISHFHEELGNGLYLRVFPRQLSFSINRLEEELIRIGAVKQMTVEMAEQFMPLAMEALYAAQSLWVEY